MKVKDVVKRTIASNVKRARIAADMTQAEAAGKLGITAQAISNFERGINCIENSLLLRMCEIYHTSMSSILGEEEENSPSELVLTEGFNEMSAIKKELILFVDELNDEQAALALRVLKSIVGEPE